MKIQENYSIKIPSTENRQAIYGRIVLDQKMNVSPECVCGICDCMCACSQCMDYQPRMGREAIKESRLETTSCLK